MSRSFLVIATACTTALAALPTTTHAQLMTSPNKPFSFGAALGAAIPLSDLSDFTNTGFNATGILGINTPSLPMNFRIELAYNEFGLKRGSGNIHNTSVSGNAVFTVPTTSTVRPYVIGGVGLYNSSSSSVNSSSSNDFGFNIGGGLTIPLSGFNAFVETRYHRIATSDVSTQFIPIVFGVMF